MNSDKSVVLLFTDWYYPGFKAGGPIQSCVNLVRAMASEYRFYVITSDRDLDSETAYNQVPLNQWSSGIFGEQVFYASPGFINQKWLKQLFEQYPGSRIYLNSMFSLPFTLLPLLVSGRFRNSRLILAPRGMLHPGALGLKSGKKKIFLRIFRWMDWHKRICFQATTEEEAGYIKQHFPGAAIRVVGNIPAFREQKPSSLRKVSGELKLLFLGRLHPTKNLDYVLDLLQQNWVGQIELHLIGEPGPSEYVEKCRKKIKELSSSVQVREYGSLPQQESFEKILEAHALVLPSLGENFGHAIFEALISGKPVLISDRTPWRKLVSQQAGWDLPLEQPEQFEKAIGRLLEMDQDTYEQWSEGAYRLANNYFTNAAYNKNYRELFT
jgi:glycosyltransferase involved in cell wall biosynthesis